MISKKSVSAPIPIPHGNARSFLQRGNNLHTCRKTVAHSMDVDSGNKSNASTPVSSPLERGKYKPIAVSAPIFPTADAEEHEHDLFCNIEFNYEYYEGLDNLFKRKEHHVHLVNGMNVDNAITDRDTFYVFCDCPKIKNISNRLSYSLLETKRGLLAFSNKDHMQVLKDYLKLPHYIVEINKNDLLGYACDNKSSVLVLYNSYTDLETKSSYFLYFNMNL